MAIGDNGGNHYQQGVMFTSSANGYFLDFTFAGNMITGTADWVFTLQANSSGLPGGILETFAPVDVHSGTTTTATTYVVASSQHTFLAANQSYWLMASIPGGTGSGYGNWAKRPGSGLRAFCNEAVGCPSYGTTTDAAAGGLRVRVDTESTSVSVPEPATIWLMLAGAILLATTRRRQWSPTQG
jgi:hypothetical protein